MHAKTKSPAGPQKHSPAKLKRLTTEQTGALSPADSVEKAAKRMRVLGAKTWPVADDRTLVGMIDLHDPDVEIAGRGHDPKAWHVSEIMKRDVVFCYEDDDCAAATRLMEEHGLNFIPVVDRTMRIVGIFDREQIAARALKGHRSRMKRMEKSRSTPGSRKSGRNTVKK